MLIKDIGAIKDQKAFFFFLGMSLAFYTLYTRQWQEIQTADKQHPQTIPLINVTQCAHVQALKALKSSCCRKYIHMYGYQRNYTSFNIRCRVKSQEDVQSQGEMCHIV